MLGELCHDEVLEKVAEEESSIKTKFRAMESVVAKCVVTNEEPRDAGGGDDKLLLRLLLSLFLLLLTKMHAMIILLSSCIVTSKLQCDPFGEHVR